MLVLQKALSNMLLGSRCVQSGAFQSSGCGVRLDVGIWVADGASVVRPGMSRPESHGTERGDSRPNKPPALHGKLSRPLLK